MTKCVADRELEVTVDRLWLPMMVRQLFQLLNEGFVDKLVFAVTQQETDGHPNALDLDHYGGKCKLHFYEIERAIDKALRAVSFQHVKPPHTGKQEKPAWIQPHVVEEVILSAVDPNQILHRIPRRQIQALDVICHVAELFFGWDRVELLVIRGLKD